MRIPTVYCDNTFRKAPISLATIAEMFRPWPMPPTTGPASLLDGELRRKCLQTNYTRIHDTVLRRPVESALISVMRVEHRTSQGTSECIGSFEGVPDEFGTNQSPDMPGRLRVRHSENVEAAAASHSTCEESITITDAHRQERVIQQNQSRDMPGRLRVRH